MSFRRDDSNPYDDFGDQPREVDPRNPFGVQSEESAPGEPVSSDDLLFVGFNSRVCALHRETGELVWDWKSPQGSGFVTLLFDVDRLFASVGGYTYCLEPSTGAQLWFNPLKGMGIGTPCLATVRSQSNASLLGESAAQQARNQQAAAGHNATMG
jgi:outer membrane protein assembly factor BamB